MKIPRLISLFLILSTSLGTAAEDPTPEILIVSPPSLKDAWQLYAKQRTNEFHTATVVSTDDIDSSFEGADLQEKIRGCIRQYIDEHHARWIILGGDSTPDGGLIPDRDTFHENMWGNDRDIPTDVYYISPTNWDHDQDGVYGEWKDDREAISYPDGTVAIGRIPVRTVDDVKAYANKVKHYLAKENTSGSLALTCAVPGANPKVYRSGNELIPAKWPKGKINFLFTDFSTWDGETNGDYDLSPENLIEKMNEGDVDKWHLHGHGLFNCWVLENNRTLSIKRVKELKNLDHLPVITTVSCFTGQFDNKKDPCISEAMLRHPDGGAIAIVAPAREGKPHFHNPKTDFPLMAKEGKLDGTTQTMTSFWIAALGEKKTIGEALSISKASLADDAEKSATYHQGMCEINLLGDPSLPVR